MKLDKYHKQLTAIMESIPNPSEIDIINATDDEGNWFQKVHFSPSLGKFTEELCQFDTDEDNINAVCIN